MRELVRTISLAGMGITGLSAVLENVKMECGPSVCLWIGCMSVGPVLSVFWVTDIPPDLTEMSVPRSFRE